jgi:hypothetical protein
MMHGVTAAVMAALPGPHWQTKSVRPQLEAGMADAKQVCCRQLDQHLLREPQGDDLPRKPACQQR